MTKNELLQIMKKQLIVSCQALADEPLYDAERSIMPFMAKAAKRAGVKLIRTSSIRDIVAIKKETSLPVIGIIKKAYPPFSPYITVTMDEIDALVKAGSDIIALDCTLRERPDGLTINEHLKNIKKKYPNILLMADISNLEEGINAYKAGVDFVGTTLNGYTEYTKNDKAPNFELIKNLVANIPIPVIAEGRIHTPEQAKKMLELGAYSVVVGGAITRPLEITNRFLEGMGLK